MTTVELPQVYTFPRPTRETFRGYSDNDLLAWLEHIARLRADSIESDDERTESTVAYCEYRMNAMLEELEHRKRQARRFRNDPFGPQWSVAGSRERRNLVDIAQDLKRAWPIDRFLTDLMMVTLIPAGRNRWRAQCVSPAHRDGTPSMVVYDDGHVHCFGCGLHGDVIDLTSMYFGIETFVDTVRKLAEVTGSPVEELAG